MIRPEIDFKISLVRNSSKLDLNIGYVLKILNLTDNDIDRLRGRSSARSRVTNRDRVRVAISLHLAIQIARLDHSRCSITVKLRPRRQAVESRVR